MSPRQSRVATFLVVAFLSAPAGAGNEIVTDVPPPADRVEHAPPARDGYAWAPGHWEWNSRSYVWVSGTWVLERRAAHWVADRWQQVETKWHYIPGHWER